MDKIVAIRKLVIAGRGADVLAFLEGESPYTSKCSSGAPQQPEHRRLWIIAVHHLRFVSEYGACSPGVYKDGKYISALTEGFEQWLEAGAPGVDEGDIRSFLKDFPFVD